MGRVISSWGNYPKVTAETSSFHIEEQLTPLVQNGADIIARGMGRSYGDSALALHAISTLPHNRIISFDEESGLITCESGVTLETILDELVPRGWFLPVTPGTKYITVGGAIASDVHGKNHHTEGTFSEHVISLRIMLADGSVVDCSPTENETLFRATCGGMGLTGIILSAVFRMKKIESAWIKLKEIRASGLRDLMSLFEASVESDYSVAWIDCQKRGGDMGRGVLMLGEHATKGELPLGREPLALPRKTRLTVPFFLPGFLLNRYSVTAFNNVYWSLHGGAERLVDYDTFFYPLDFVGSWNRIYGRAGFLQYQFVLPRESSMNGISEALREVARSGNGSFLAVLKLFGAENKNILSFPMEGYTVALDFPVSGKSFRLLDRLDEIVVANGGRIYLTKDARMPRDVFRKGYKRAEEFLDLRRSGGGHSRFISLQSGRLGI